ncbi:hypothetical protein BR93DRAFT_922575 [Coniochaeta sp. PMI_546]|nr:hypothetical protein BR93DRAFT_922575 [Coniochaeta sp. PMI_546]
MVSCNPKCNTRARYQRPLACINRVANLLLGVGVRFRSVAPALRVRQGGTHYLILLWYFVSFYDKQRLAWML